MHTADSMFIGVCAQVRELVLPLGHHALRSVWNPASKRQSRAAAALLADLLVYVPADDPKMQVGQLLPLALPKLCAQLPVPSVNCRMLLYQPCCPYAGTIPGLNEAQLDTAVVAYVSIPLC